MQNRGAPDAACGRPSSSYASTTSSSVGQQQQQRYPASRQGSTMNMGRAANQNDRDQGGGDQPGRPGLRKIASSFDKVKRAFTFRIDNGGTSSRPGSSSSRSGAAAAAAAVASAGSSDARAADVTAVAGRRSAYDSNVDEPVRRSRVGEQGESEHAGAVELTQANPRFSYGSDHAPLARR
ncbi:hypothetical protein PspLS_05881 [Pyricularia sp. CBS 133598]|nr:hypothetical protein PspLS_05881 [Pyricularia sp. CBS 133598]